ANAVAWAYVAGWVAAAVAGMAIALLVSRIVHGDVPDVRAALRGALWNLPGAIGIGIAAMLGFLLVGAPALALRAGYLRFGAGPLTTFLTAIDAAVLVAAALLAYVTYHLAQTALAIEDLGAGEALAKTIARVAAPGSLKRVAAASLAFLVTYAGIVFAWAWTYAGLWNWTHQAAPAVLASTLVAAALVPVLQVFVTMFYFDLRIRREAYDLEASLTAMEAAHV
ncbi:MAG TPA: hypothetical protein VFA29_07205, partial [Candidatus Baltobacteraceae bacterium]|nr:hypothetical protein [Candidatus Baltobacteraceae bacterium]